LISVNGVGPKAAMGILSTLEPDALSLAILTEDAKTISKAPGIGLKTAKKVILELKDKMKDYDFFDSMEQEDETISQTVASSNVRLETIEAMKSLGYSHVEAVKAVKQIKFTEDMSVEKAIKLALKAVL
jgi:Holliday junction DNA helicase RuvA